MSLFRGGHLPFEGLKFCATSVPTDIKKHIIEKIISMGGSVSNHLMEDTNILIVGMTNTEKYRYCAQKRYDIRYISPSSILAIYEEWMKVRGTNYLISDNDLNSKQSYNSATILDKYALLPFEGMVVCLSRLSKSANPLYRKDNITSLIEKYGGKVTESLTISNTIVITLETSGKRYDKACEWDIPCVHPKWVLDSVVRGAVLEFRFYEITKFSSCDENEIGKDAFFHWDKFTERRNKVYQLNNLENYDDEEAAVFANAKFTSYGFPQDQAQKLKRIILLNEGDVVDFESGKYLRHCIIVVPTTISYSELYSEIKPAFQSLKENGNKVVTEWFIERCLYYKSMKFDSWSLPRKHTNLDFNFKISISGFSGVELLHITKLIGSLGCELCETFNEECDFLVVNLSTINVTRENRPILFSYKFSDILDIKVPERHSKKNTIDKINASKEWNIPIVSIAFLWEMAERGSLPNLLEYKWCIFGPKTIKDKKGHIPAKGIDDKNSENTYNYNEDAKRDKVNSNNEAESQEECEVLSASAYKKNDDNVVSAALERDKDSRPDSITVKLPSPRKNKSKRWPRLVGTAAESQLPSTSSLLVMDKTRKNLSNRLHYENAVTELQDETIPQVSYALDEYELPARKKVKQYGKRA